MYAFSARQIDRILSFYGTRLFFFPAMYPFTQLRPTEKVFIRFGIDIHFASESTPTSPRNRHPLRLGIDTHFASEGKSLSSKTGKTAISFKKT